MIARLSCGVGVKSRVPSASSSTAGLSWPSSGSSCCVALRSSGLESTCGGTSLSRRGVISVRTVSSCGRISARHCVRRLATGEAASGTPPGTASFTSLLLYDISTAREK